MNKILSYSIIMFIIISSSPINSFSNDLQSSVHISPDEKYVASGNKFGVKIWDIATGKKILDIPQRLTTVVKFSPDSRYILTAGRFAPTIWEIPSGLITIHFINNYICRRN